MADLDIIQAVDKDLAASATTGFVDLANVVQGNSILVMVICDTSVCANTVDDDVNLTAYTEDKSVFLDSGNTKATTIFHLSDVDEGTTRITVDLTGNVGGYVPSIAAIEIEGNLSVSGTPTGDLIRAASGTSSSITPAAYDALLYCGWVADLAMTYDSGSDGWTQRSANDSASSDRNRTFTNKITSGSKSISYSGAGHNSDNGIAIVAYIAVVSANTCSGTPDIASPTASGVATIFKRGNGTPDVATPTASGTVIQTQKPSGTPSIDVVTASGVATTFKRATGAITAAAVTAAGVAALTAAPLTSNGTPNIASPTASGVATIFKRSNGTPSVEALTASGIARYAHDSSGTPSTDVATASGVAVQTYKPSGTPSLEVGTASGVATISKRGNGTPSVISPTASGVVVQTYKPFGTPSIETTTASGVARYAHDSSGTPSTDVVTASGVAVQTYKPSGTPSIEAVTASGVVVQTQKPSGAPSIETVTASGVAALQGQLTASGTPLTDVAIAVGTAVQTYKPSGTPSLDVATASGVARYAHDSSGTPSVDVITASGVAALAGGAALTASGTPSLAALTASGSATKGEVAASGTPGIEAPTASGTVILAPRVWLNTSQTLAGATAMTRTGWNATGTFIAFTDPVGAPTGPGRFLGVENRNVGGGDSNTGWIEVAISGSLTVGTPSIATVTATGVADKIGEITPRVASGTPSLVPVTTNGIVNVFGGSAGLPTLSVIIASGVAIKAPRVLGSGTPSIEAVTSSGTANVQGQLASAGVPVLAAITASGVASATQIPISRDIPRGILGFSSHVPTSNPTLSTDSAAGALSLSSQAPTTNVGFNLAVPAAALSFTEGSVVSIDTTVNSAGATLELESLTTKRAVKRLFT